MAKRDWLRECNDQNVPPQEFHQIFCVRCRNPDCTRAGYAGSLWADRIGTQVERLLDNPQFADLSLPQYAQINALDFPDALRQALRIEIANKRKDWTLPEDLTPEQAMQELAATATAKPEPKTKAAALAVTLDEEISSEPDSPDEIEDATPDVAPAPVLTKPNQPVLLNRTNTAFPVGGVMLDGSRPTQTAQPAKPATPPLVVDPWAAPTPVENVVAVGAKIRLGFATADAASKGK